MAAQGTTLAAAGGEGPGYEVNGTIMRLRLPKPLVPGGTADLAFDWKLRVPPDGAPRGGQDGEVYYMNYWYPQMAVYDDVNGWQIDQYLGNAEFYMGYGNYDVSLTLPAGWLVTATGTLQNPDEVLTQQTRARLDSARSATGVVHVVTDVDREPGRSTTAGKDGKLTWHFRAQNVRDVSWAASSRYLWDATNAAVGDANNDGRPDTTLIQAFWRPEQRVNHWDESARYSRYSIEFYSKYLWPYPYPHMTAVDGPNSCGGMEYPMMTCIGGQWDTLGMYEVTTHEIGHMWFPMMVGSDEKRFAWMDEGLTQFDQSQSMDEFFKGFDDEERNRKNYLDAASVRRRGRADASRRPVSELQRLWRRRLLQAGHRHGRAPGRAGPRPVPQGVHRVRPPVAVQAPDALRFLRHLRRRVGPGPVVVLADLVLRDLAPRPGDRQRRHRGRLGRDRHREPRPGADAGAAGGHPGRREGGQPHRAGGRLAGGRQADHGPGGAGARGEEHRDRSGARVSGRGPGQSAMAEVRQSEP